MAAFATAEQWASLTGRPLPTDPVELADLNAALADAWALLSTGPLLAARYRTDPSTGIPVLQTVSDALTAANVWQAVFTTAVDPEGFGIPLEAVTVGPVALTGSPSAAAGGVGPYAPRAIRILILAGLYSARVGAY